MKLDYLCPKCKGHLRIGDQLILAARNKDQISGLILFHPRLGNYKIDHHNSFVIKKGEQLNFSCPLCAKKLYTKLHDNLTKLILRDEKHQEFEVLFSSIAGQESTYKIEGETMEFFGKDSDDYIQFIQHLPHFY